MACCQRMESTPLDPMLNLDIHRVVVHPDIRKKVIRLLDENGDAAMTWTLQNAFPLQITPTDMNSTASEAGIETIVFAHEGLVQTTA